MPELPEVETVLRALEPTLKGATLKRVELRRKNLRFPFPKGFTKKLTGRAITNLSRRAKYLLITLESQDILVIHLGMSGRLTLRAKTKLAQGAPSDPKHDHVVFHLGDRATLTYNDPRRFGFMDLVPADELDTHRLFHALGPEPLGNHFSADHLASKAGGRKVDLKALLLDQRTVAGLGNIYVCEALHLAALSPTRAASSLATSRNTPTKRADRLVPAIRDVLNKAIKAGGSSLKDFQAPDGALGYFQHSFKVYGRTGQPCPTKKCTGTITRITQSGRSTFYCPKCQR